MSSSGRRKAKADAIARLNALWVLVAPRIILLGSRISASEAESLGTVTEDLPTDYSGRFSLFVIYKLLLLLKPGAQILVVPQSCHLWKIFEKT